MSHAATNWAIKQRGLKPAAKVVLWHLADRHNPDSGCFPSQALLAADCEMSRSTLNEHLRYLETAGFIRREQRMNAATKRQEATRYVLAFEDEKPCPETGHGAVSGKGQKPCPEKAKSRVRNPDTNPVREPVREPARERAKALEGKKDPPRPQRPTAFQQALEAGKIALPSLDVLPKMPGGQRVRP